MTKLLRILFLPLAASLAALAPASAENEIQTTADVIEAKIHKVVDRYIPPSEYVALIEVKDEKAAESGKDEQSLKYSSLKVNLSYLQKMADQIFQQNLSVANFKVDLVIDSKVSEKLEKLIYNKLRVDLEIDNTNRSLKVSREDLRAIEDTIEGKAPSSEEGSASLENERLKLEIERTKKKLEGDLQNATLANQQLAIQVERQKLEELKREEQLREKLQSEGAGKAKPGEDAKASKGSEGSFLGYAKDFQYGLIGLLAALVMILAAFLLAKSHKGGLGSLSTALQTVGDKIAESAKKGDAGGEGGGGSAGERSGESSMAAMGREGAVAGGGAGEVLQAESGEDFRRFLSLVEDKIETMSEDGNFVFFRHFLDIVQTDIEMAAAILVSVKPEVAQRLVTRLDVETTAQIREFLSQPGSLEKPRSMRGQALQTFYGKIAAEEFVNSPLLKIKGIEWLFRMTGEDVKELALQVEENAAAALFACLSTSRLVSIVKSARDDSERKKLINLVKKADDVTENVVESAFAELTKAFERLDKNKERQARKLIDSGRFYGDLLDKLPEGDQQVMMQALSDRLELMEDIKRYFVPFSVIAKLHDDIILQIFGRRSSSQNALILLAADEATRNKILSVLPAALRDSVTEEVESLSHDKANKKTNEDKSQRLQKEIGKYLVELNRQDALIYAEGAAPLRPKNAA